MIERPNIIAVLEHYGLRVIGADRGGWRKAQCPKPEHEDSNPSASVNEALGKWFCHACNVGGDGLDIIQEREGIAGVSDAQRFAEGIAGASDGIVSEERGHAGGLPRTSRNKPRGGRSVPAWLRIR